MDKSIESALTFVFSFFSAINAILCSISGNFDNCATTWRKCAAIFRHEKTDINVEREQRYNFNRGCGVNRKKIRYEEFADVRETFTPKTNRTAGSGPNAVTLCRKKR